MQSLPGRVLQCALHHWRLEGQMELVTPRINILFAFCLSFAIRCNSKPRKQIQGAYLRVKVKAPAHNRGSALQRGGLATPFPSWACLERSKQLNRRWHATKPILTHGKGSVESRIKGLFYGSAGVQTSLFFRVLRSLVAPWWPIFRKGPKSSKWRVAK